MCPESVVKKQTFYSILHNGGYTAANKLTTGWLVQLFIYDFGDFMSTEFKLGELFCGPGGLALGAALAEDQSKGGKTFSISHVWGVDKDPAAIETYIHNIANEYGGVGRCIGAHEFCDNEIDNYKRITALAFGFPCNDFSLVGKRKGVNGDYGKLYEAGIKAIEKKNPYWFIAENVSGINSANAKETFPKILDALARAGKKGYNLTVHKYRFEEYGVPQYRHRFIIVGIRKDKKLTFKVPAPICKSADEYVSAEKAISEIPEGSPNSEFTRQFPHVVTRLKYTPPWHNAWYLDELFEMSDAKRRDELKEKLPWYDEEISGLSDYMIKKEIKDSKLNCTKALMSHIYRRLHPDKPAYTITGSGGGGTHVYHWREHRALTNRERAKLQSFPDWFEFKGPRDAKGNLKQSKEQERKQIGMAVPPKAAKIIFEAILKTFAGIEYDSIPPNYHFENH